MTLFYSHSKLRRDLSSVTFPVVCPKKGSVVTFSHDGMANDAIRPDRQGRLLNAANFRSQALSCLYFKKLNIHTCNSPQNTRLNVLYKIDHWVILWYTQFSRFSPQNALWIAVIWTSYYGLKWLPQWFIIIKEANFLNSLLWLFANCSFDFYVGRRNQETRNSVMKFFILLFRALLLYPALGQPVKIVTEDQH